MTEVYNSGSEKVASINWCEGRYSFGSKVFGGWLMKTRGLGHGLRLLGKDPLSTAGLRHNM